MGITVRRVMSAVIAGIVGFAVLLMHHGAMPLSMLTMPAVSHAALHPVQHDDAVVAAGDAHVDKQTISALHEHEAHDCVGTVVVAKSVGAPPFVAVLPRSDGAGSPAPADRAAAARGPPAWTVLDLAELCVLRV